LSDALKPDDDLLLFTGWIGKMRARSIPRPIHSTSGRVALLPDDLLVDAAGLVGGHRLARHSSPLIESFRSSNAAPAGRGKT
jgi:hypothetical protein